MSETIQVRMARPDEEDFSRVLFFFQGCEAMFEENVIIKHQIGRAHV